MRDIQEVLLRGSSKERLAIIADIATILGVSLFAAIAPLIAGLSLTKFNNVALIVIYSLIFVGGHIAIFVATSVIANKLKVLFSSSRHSNLIAWSVWLFWGAILVFTITYSINELSYTNW